MAGYQVEAILQPPPVRPAAEEAMRRRKAANAAVRAVGYDPDSLDVARIDPQLLHDAAWELFAPLVGLPDTTPPGHCRRCNTVLAMSAISTPGFGDPNRRGYCSTACEANTAVLPEPGPTVPAADGFAWGFLAGGRTRHILGDQARAALCGAQPGERGVWRGAASPGDRQRLAALRPCRTCLKFRPDAAGWAVPS